MTRLKSCSAKAKSMNRAPRAPIFFLMAVLMLGQRS